MLDFVSRAPELLGRVAGMVRSADVLRRAGMVPLRPDETVRALLDVRGLGPIAGAIAVAARRNPRAIGVADERGALTFTQLSNRSNALARGWQADGIGAGSTIALLCRDHRWMVDAMGAAAKIGAKLLLMNTGFSKPQLADVVEREGVAAIVHDQEFTDLLSAIDGVPRYVAWVDDAATVNGDAATLEALIVNNSDLPLPAPRSPGGMTLLTSGTTGTPKGAPRQIRSPLVAAQFLDRIPLRAGEATFVAAPLFHATGLSQFILSLGLGCTVVLRRRFDPEETLRGIERHRCTALVLVPTMLQRILDLGPEVLGRYDTSSLRIIFCAGSAISPELGNRAMSAFGDVLYNLYGSTEVAVASVATPEDWRAAPGTVGKAPQGCRVRLYDADGKRITAPNTQGRIFVASTLSFGGYSGGGNKEVVDGMLSSGDVGHFDADGRLFVDGRDDDMIVSGGENVFPVEIENLLVEHAKINDAAVIGVPDEDFGQRLKAFVVPEKGHVVTEDEVKAYVKANLARYKVPRDVVFIDELPRNPTGKVLRNKLS